MELFLKVLTIVGSMGLFLYGMKLLSEALQRVAGRRLRSTVDVMTSTVTRSLFSGIGITSIVQSSSAVTVMIVSLVNAGIVTLKQSVGLLLGANIGTTTTAWVICLFGLHLSVSAVAVPLAGLGFALILIKRDNYNAVGSMIMGFALMFIGLNILRTSFEFMIESTSMAQILVQYSNLGFLSVLIMLLVGVLLTAIVQSSSATITLTLILCQNGWIPLEAGAAMILGENIGTTVTANIAAIVANTSAKRAALTHTAINVIGVLWALPLLPLAVSGIEWLLVSLFGVSPVTNLAAAPFAMALFHTLFNTINALLLINFTPSIVRLMQIVIPQGQNEARRRLRVFESGLLSTSELSLMQASNELINHSKRTLKMFRFVRALVSETDGAKFEELFGRIKKYEQITDDVEREIIGYLAEISRGNISYSATHQIQSMFRVVSHVEIIADTNLQIAKIIRRKKENNLWFNQELREKLFAMFDLVEQALYSMITNLEQPSSQNYERSVTLEQSINHSYSTLLGEQMSLTPDNHEYKYVSAMVFSELINECEKLGDTIMNICSQTHENQ